MSVTPTSRNRKSVSKLCGPLLPPQKIMTISYPICEKIRNKNRRERNLLCPPDPYPKSATRHTPPTPPSPLFIIYQTHLPPPLHTKPCPSNTSSRTKPSVRSPTSFATTATTGTILHQHSPYHAESQESSHLTQATIKTQDH
jgi:hypothetical protein